MVGPPITSLNHWCRMLYCIVTFLSQYLAHSRFLISCDLHSTYGLLDIVWKTLHKHSMEHISLCHHSGSQILVSITQSTVALTSHSQGCLSCTHLSKPDFSWELPCYLHLGTVIQLLLMFLLLALYFTSVGKMIPFRLLNALDKHDECFPGC